MNTEDLILSIKAMINKFGNQILYDHKLFQKILVNQNGESYRNTIELISLILKEDLIEEIYKLDESNVEETITTIHRKINEKYALTEKGAQDLTLVWGIALNKVHDIRMGQISDSFTNMANTIRAGKDTNKLGKLVSNLRPKNLKKLLAMIGIVVALVVFTRLGYYIVTNDSEENLNLSHPVAEALKEQRNSSTRDVEANEKKESVEKEELVAKVEVHAEPDVELETKGELETEVDDTISHDVAAEQINDDEIQETSTQDNDAGNAENIEDKKVASDIDTTNEGQDSSLSKGIEALTSDKDTQELDNIVRFKDANLESVVRKAIGKENGDILIRDVEGIEELDGQKSNIQDLTGLEYFTNIKELNLSYNSISDLTPLANLTSLITLKLRANNITDISPLSNLKMVTTLWLNDNQIKDISSLKTTYYRSLDLSKNQIKDISGIKELVDINYLNLSENQIESIGSITGIRQVNYLYLQNNNISDLSPLINKLNILYLQISSNNFTFEEYENLIKKYDWRVVTENIRVPELSNEELAINRYGLRREYYDNKELKGKPLAAGYGYIEEASFSYDNIHYSKQYAKNETFKEIHCYMLIFVDINGNFRRDKNEPFSIEEIVLSKDKPLQYLDIELRTDN